MKTAIDIHNYEEFFLLYVDNELSAAEGLAVEAFVAAHPDLLVELEMLQQVQLGRDEVLFEDKSLLYRKESEEISLANYEEHFLLYVDNELDREARGKVERFVLQHPALQEVFTQLKATRLEEDRMVFQHKASLYRKEEKERPVFYMHWKRMAVAAAFIGLTVLVWTIVPRNTTDHTLAGLRKGNTQNPVTGNGSKADDASKEVRQNNVIENRPNDQPIASTSNRMNSVSDPIATRRAAQQVTNTTAAANLVESYPANNNAIIAATEPPVRSVEPVRTETVTAANRTGTETITTNTQMSGDEHAVRPNDVITASNTDAAGGPNNMEVQPAVYRELDTEDDKKSLLLGSLEINKDKLRGFFRKAGSIFRSKSKADDERTESRPSSNTRSLK